jgi:hypothetical protein
VFKIKLFILVNKSFMQDIDKISSGELQFQQKRLPLSGTRDAKKQVSERAPEAMHRRTTPMRSVWRALL